MRIWQKITKPSVDRHIHVQPYVSILLAGSYEEAGDFGRFVLAPGDVLVHDCFEAHLDRFASTGAAVLNLGISSASRLRPGLFKVEDLDSLVMLAEKDLCEAKQSLEVLAIGKTQPILDWPDELAASLRSDGRVKLTTWAEERGMKPWTLSRGFRHVYEISPEQYRHRAMARTAWNLMSKTRLSFVQISQCAGFCDQSHMTHSVKALTGYSPRHWRSFRHCK